MGRKSNWIPPPYDSCDAGPYESDDENSLNLMLPQNYRSQQVRAFHTERAALRGEGESNLANLQQYASFEGGELAPLGEEFTLFQLVKDFPWRFVGKKHQHRVAKYNFDNEQLYSYPWSFFYLHRLESQNSAPLILVLTSQFKHYLEKINALGRKPALLFPTGEAAGAYQAYFEDESTPCPRYLGATKDHTELEYLKNYNIFPAHYRKEGEPATTTPTTKSVESFKAILDTMLAAQKAKNAANKAVAKKKRAELKHSWGSAIKRVQRYVGLREKIPESREWIPSPKMKYPKFEADNLAPAVRDLDVVFVCIDVEAWEGNNNIITEIGIASLDTRDLATVSPGEKGEKWHALIQARHFLIQDYDSPHYVNRNFVTGYPDKFLFGTTEKIPRSDSTPYIRSCFKEPFAKRTSGVTRTPETDVNELPERKIVFVGHNIASDISFLQKVGFNVFAESNIIEHLDTAVMYQFMTRQPNPTKLSSAMNELGLASWYTHNGGNDAVYTLQAMVSIAIRDLVDKAEAKESKKEQELAAQQHIEEWAKAPTEGHQEDWPSGGEESDGGLPVTPHQFPSLKKDKYMASGPAPVWDNSSAQAPWGGFGGEEKGMGDTSAWPSSAAPKKSGPWELEDDYNVITSAPAQSWDHANMQLSQGGLGGGSESMRDDANVWSSYKVPEKSNPWQLEDDVVASPPAPAGRYIAPHLRGLLKKSTTKPESMAWEDELATATSFKDTQAGDSTPLHGKPSNHLAPHLRGLPKKSTTKPESMAWEDEVATATEVAQPPDNVESTPGNLYQLTNLLQEHKKNQSLAWDDLPRIDDETAKAIADLTIVQSKTDRISEWLGDGTSFGEKGSSSEANMGGYDPAGDSGRNDRFTRDPKKKRFTAWE